MTGYYRDTNNLINGTGYCTREELEKFYNLYHNDDPCLEEFDSFEEWFEESRRNGYFI